MGSKTWDIKIEELLAEILTEVKVLGLDVEAKELPNIKETATEIKQLAGKIIQKVKKIEKELYQKKGK